MVQFPIIVNELGEGIMEYFHKEPGGCEDRDIRPGNKVSEVIGKHQFCGGHIVNHPITERQNALCCATCNLRIIIPKTIDTFSKLRKHFIKYNS